MGSETARLSGFRARPERKTNLLVHHCWMSASAPPAAAPGGSQPPAPPPSSSQTGQASAGASQRQRRVPLVGPTKEGPPTSAVRTEISSAASREAVSEKFQLV
eukprot:4197232-Prymnesium_polylepis.1